MRQNKYQLGCKTFTQLSKGITYSKIVTSFVITCKHINTQQYYYYYYSLKKVSIIITATNSLKKYTSYIYTIRSLSGDVFPLREYLLNASHFPEFAVLFVWVVQVC